MKPAMKTAWIAAFLAAWLGACAAQAAQLRLTVLGADGKPAPDVAVQLQPTGIWASLPLPEPVLIVQQNIRFVPYVTVVPVGATVRFVNRDRFDHHVRSQPGGPLGNVAPVQQFEFRLAAVRGGREAPAADVVLDTPGSIALGCHLHGSMRGHLVVSATPWVAVSDAQGVATLHGVPEGAVLVKLWHPDQLVDQPVTRLQTVGDTRAEASLNFSPRRRPAPSTRGNDYTY